MYKVDNFFFFFFLAIFHLFFLNFNNTFFPKTGPYPGLKPYNLDL